MLDYEGLQRSLTEDQVLKVMERLGAHNVKDCGDYLLFHTICHNYHEDEAKMNLAYYKDRKLFHCFSECGCSFNIFTLAAKRLDLESEEYTMSDIFFLVLNHSDLTWSSLMSEEVFYRFDAEKYSDDQKPRLPEYDDTVMQCFYSYYPIEWLDDGISKEAMDHYGIKYSPSRNKIIIPHNDADGRLIGIRGRALNRLEAERYGKYMPIRVESQLYNHPTGLNLFGLDKVKENIKKNGLAIIAEGEKSPLQAETFLGREDNVVVASCGNKINKWQVRQLVEYGMASEIILAYDKEEDSQGAYFERLYNMCAQYTSYANFSFLYDFDNLLRMKDSPFDRGKSVFLELITRRVKIREN